MQTLLHTIRIKRLDLTSPQRISSAACDFSKLSWFDENSGQVMNSGNPFIADTVAARPFEQSTKLGAGVHLHFILPPALTRFADDPNAVLEAPNRWLINKIRNDEVIESTVVESDFLSLKPQFPGRSQSTTLLPVDVNASGYKVFKELSQPFLYMGRVLPLEDYHKKKAEETNEMYWRSTLETPFTAFVYGDTHFSTFYPNCLSVFGFYDPNGIKSDHYEVSGWYEDSRTNKPVSYFNQIHDVISKETNNAKAGLAAKFGLKMSEEFLQSDESIKTDHQNLLFYGRSENSDEDDLKSWEQPKMALGNGVEEAFSALLSGELAKGEKSIDLERTLEALQFDHLRQQTLDLAPEFESSRHRKGFSGQYGWFLFELEFKKNTTKEAPNDSLAKMESKFSKHSPQYKALRTEIEKLNALLTAYEKNASKIANKKALLFSHWQKYLQSAHPPLLTGETLPDNNRILHFIKSKVLPDLRKIMAQTGILLNGTEGEVKFGERTKLQVELELFGDQMLSETAEKGVSWFYTASHYSNANVQEEISPEIERSLAEKVVLKLKGIKKRMEALNKTDIFTSDEVELVLKHARGEMYYSPTEPTLLLGNEWLKKFEVKEEDSTRLLSLFHLNQNLNEVLAPNDFGNAKSLGIELEDSIKEIAQPLFLDWEVYFMPLEVIASSHKTYTNNFISKTFQILQEDPEFSIRPDSESEPALSKTSRYVGRTIPIYNNGQTLDNKLKQLTDATQKGNIKNFITEKGFIAQRLDGLNAAFVQEKSLMQLPIGDPIAFSDFKKIYRELGLADFMDINRYHSPEPQFDFSPVRSGALHLKSIALIDTFGRQKRFDTDKVHTAETMKLEASKAWKTDNLPKIHAFFQPRFIQKTAITAHWMKADTNELIYSETTNDSPVCGWLVPNFLKKALAIYTANGEHLGNILKVKDTIRFEAGPYQAAFDPDNVENEPLKNFLKYLGDLSDMNAFLRLIHECLLFVDPENAPNHNELNYFFGRPMALVRMQVDFITQGDYQCRKDHYAFNEMLKNGDPNPQTAAYEKVEIPLRIGDYTKLNEGVVMYWNDADINAKGSYDHVFSTSCLPEEKKEKSKLEAIKKTITVKPQMTHSLDADPHRLTLLIDPRADIHICSGVAPMKEMRLPERFWKETLSRLRINFEMGPGMFPKNEIRINLPETHDYGWSWLQKRMNADKETVFTEIPQLPAIRKSIFETEIQKEEMSPVYSWNKLVEDKILQPGVNNDPEYALIDTTKLQPKDEDEAAQLAGLMAFLDAHATGISSVETAALFTTNELHDGWIECYQSNQMNTH